MAGTENLKQHRITITFETSFHAASDGYDNKHNKKIGKFESRCFYKVLLRKKRVLGESEEYFISRNRNSFLKDEIAA